MGCRQIQPRCEAVGTNRPLLSSQTAKEKLTFGHSDSLFFLLSQEDPESVSNFPQTFLLSFWGENVWKSHIEEKKDLK